MLQEDFVRNVLTSFRYSVYVTRDTSSAIGRARLSNIPTYDDNNFLVLDRLGNLGHSFSNILDRAKQKLPTQFSFSYYSVDGKIVLDCSVLSQYSAFLSMLSSTPSIYSLVETVKKHFSVTSNSNDKYDEYIAREQVFSILDFLERINYITLYRVAATTTVASTAKRSDQSNNKKQSSTSVNVEGDSKQPSNLDAKVAKMRKMGFPESTIQSVIEKERLKDSGQSAQASKPKTETSTSKPVGSAEAIPDSTNAQDLLAHNADWIASRDAKIAKMKKLGFPDDAIQGVINKDAKIFLSTHAVSNSSPDSASPGSTEVQTAVSASEASQVDKKQNEPKVTDHLSTREAKIAKMRKMGFPESTILELLKKEPHE